MCGLCGTFGGAAHWAEGLAPFGSLSPASAVPSLRRGARRRLVAQGNRLLCHYALAMEDWQGTSFVLRGRTGGAEVVAGIADLWPKAERLRSRPIDPLDPVLLDALDACQPDR